MVAVPLRFWRNSVASAATRAKHPDMPKLVRSCGRGTPFHTVREKPDTRNAGLPSEPGMPVSCTVNGLPTNGNEPDTAANCGRPAPLAQPTPNGM